VSYVTGFICSVCCGLSVYYQQPGFASFWALWALGCFLEHAGKSVGRK